MTDQVYEEYGNRLRVRACGILVENNQLLLVNHRSLSAGDFWAPPGGGVNFEEPASLCLARELKEETGLVTEAMEFLFATEFIKPPLHAVELFFRIRRLGGSLITGSDPEMKHDKQLITAVRFWNWEGLKAMHPDSLHGLFRFVRHPSQITTLKGYFKL